MSELLRDLPEPKDLSHHLSKATKSRQASSIKQFYKYFQIPGIGQLAGGEHVTNSLSTIEPVQNGVDPRCYGTPCIVHLRGSYLSYTYAVLIT